MLHTLMTILMVIFMVSSDLYVVEATCYQPLVGQTDDTPDITASGARIDLKDPLRHRWIAVSRDLENHGFTFGKRVSVSGAGRYNGTWTIQDRMNPRWIRRIDFLVGKNDFINKWDSVTIKLL